VQLNRPNAKPRNVSRNFMKIVVDNTELSFKSPFYLAPNEWESTVYYLNYQLDFMFSEDIFNESKIDWSIIKTFVSSILKNVDTIQNSGASALEKLYGTDEFYELAGIELENFNDNIFNFKTYFVLEPKKKALINSGLSHYVYFTSINHTVSLIKAERI
jgi:hypothetical protein